MGSSSSRKYLSDLACKRLHKEYTEWQVTPPPGYKHKVAMDLQRWVIDVDGPPGSLYAGEMYQLQLDFPKCYPLEPPLVIFRRPVPVHPAIYSNGHIRLDILYESWTVTMTVRSVCDRILSMLETSPIKQRPADDEQYVRSCIGKFP